MISDPNSPDHSMSWYDANDHDEVRKNEICASTEAISYACIFEQKISPHLDHNSSLT